MTTSIGLFGFMDDHLVHHPDAQLYFLLDHAGLPGIMRILDCCAMQWVSLFESTRESTALAAAPLLVFVKNKEKSPPSVFLDWIKQNGMLSSALIILDSPLPLIGLQRRLVKRLDIKLTDEMDAMLRFFDSRILAQLRENLSPEQAAAFFGVASSWWYIGRDEKLAQFDSEFTSSDNNVLPLKLSAKQEFALIEASEPDQVLSLLNNQTPHLLKEMLPAKRHNFIVGCIKEAKTLGLDAPVDFFLYMAIKCIKGDIFLKEKIDYLTSANGFMSGQEASRFISGLLINGEPLT
jgi:hypothetical protein